MSYKTMYALPGGLSVESIAEDLATIWKQAQFFSSLPMVCPINDSPTRLAYKRTKDGDFEYFTVTDQAGRYHYELGQLKKETEAGLTLYPKYEWTVWDGERKWFLRGDHWETGKVEKGKLVKSTEKAPLGHFENVAISSAYTGEDDEDEKGDEGTGNGAGTGDKPTAGHRSARTTGQAGGNSGKGDVTVKLRDNITTEKRRSYYMMLGATLYGPEKWAKNYPEWLKRWSKGKKTSLDQLTDAELEILYYAQETEMRKQIRSFADGYLTAEELREHCITATATDEKEGTPDLEKVRGKPLCDLYQLMEESYGSEEGIAF